MTNPNPFKGFQSSPEIIRLAVMMYIRFPHSLKNVGDLLYELGFDVRHKAVRYWWRRSGRDFALEVWKRRIDLRAQEDDGVKSGSPSVPFEPTGIQI